MFYYSQIRNGVYTTNSNVLSPLNSLPDFHGFFVLLFKEIVCRKRIEDWKVSQNEMRPFILQGHIQVSPNEVNNETSDICVT